MISWVMGILGAILIAAPYIFGYEGNSIAVTVSVFIGGMTTILSLIEGAMKGKDIWEYVSIGILGIAAVAAPFVFGFSETFMAVWVLLIIGGLLITLGVGETYVLKFKRTY